MRSYIEGGEGDDEALVSEAAEVADHVIHLLCGCARTELMTGQVVGLGLPGGCEGVGLEMCFECWFPSL